MDRLPDEILIMIFNHCEVLPLTQVSKRFKDVIETSCLMRKVQLIIAEKISPALKTNRNYQNVKIKFRYNDNDKIVDILGHYGSSIRQLELTRCIIDGKSLYDCFKAMPNLETLNVSSTFIKGNYLEEHDLPPLSIKNINIRTSDKRFLDLINGSLKVLHLHLPRLSTHELIKFFDRNENVEEISSFLAAAVTEDLLTRICSLKKLKKLCIDMSKVDHAFIGREIQNFTVRKLILFNEPESPHDIDGCLRIFKHLKALEMDMNVNLEPENMTNLQRTSIESLKMLQDSGDEYFNHIELPTLKHLWLASACYYPDQWTDFAQRNPNIESIVIADLSTSNEIFTLICQQFRNLNYLEVFHDPERLEIQEALNYICDDNFPQGIKTVKIKSRGSDNYYANLIFTEEQKNQLNKKIGFRLHLS
jgi:F-box-like